MIQQFVLFGGSCGVCIKNSEEFLFISTVKNSSDLDIFRDTNGELVLVDVAVNTDENNIFFRLCEIVVKPLRTKSYTNLQEKIFFYQLTIQNNYC